MKLAKIAAIAALSLTTSLSIAAPAASQPVSGLAALNLGDLFGFGNGTNATNKTETVAKLFDTDNAHVEKAANNFLAQGQHGLRTKRFGSRRLVMDLKSGEILKSPSSLYNRLSLKQLPHHARVEQALLFVRADKDDFKAADFSKHPNFSAKMPKTMRMGASSLKAFVQAANPDMVKKGFGEEVIALDQTGRVDFDSAGGKHEGLYMKQLPQDHKRAGIAVLDVAPGELKSKDFSPMAAMYGSEGM